MYTKKYGLVLFRRFLHFDSPSSGKNKETSLWMNKLMSRLFTHLRNAKVAEQISKRITFIPNTKSFKLISVGSDIEFGSITINQVDNSIQPQIFIPIKWSTFSFDIHTEWHPKVEADFRKFESVLSLTIFDDEIRFNFVKEPEYDFDLSVILWKKYMITQCPVIGDIIRVLFVYYSQKKFVSFRAPDYHSSDCEQDSPKKSRNK